MVESIYLNSSLYISNIYFIKDLITVISTEIGSYIHMCIHLYKPLTLKLNWNNMNIILYI